MQYSEHNIMYHKIFFYYYLKFFHFVKQIFINKTEK